MTLAHHQSGCNHIAKYFREYFGLNPCVFEAVAYERGSGDRRITERVDCLGFGPNFTTYAADWKTSTEDALKHMDKYTVQAPSEGVGMMRMIVCHEGVVEWTDPRFKGNRAWPEWLGLVWMREDGEFHIEVQPSIFNWQGRKVNAEWDILRRYASKARQSNSVTKRGTVDRCVTYIDNNGPRSAKALLNELKIKGQTARSLAEDLDEDDRLKQDHAGGEYRLAG